MSRTPVVPLASGSFGEIWRVRMAGDYVNGFIFRDPDGQVTLVDVGLRWSTRRVLGALAAVGAGPAAVTRIVLTHAHSDHAGAAAAVARHTGRDVDVHAADAAYLRRFAGDELSPRALRAADGSPVGQVLSRMFSGPWIRIAEGPCSPI